MKDRKSIVQPAQVELAKGSFYDYCRVRAPEFYRAERRYLRQLCEELQAFYEGTGEIMVINLPPRHGKSRTAALFAQWVLGRNQLEKIMVGSYNRTLSTSLSKAVRDGIAEQKRGRGRTVFSEIFPMARIKAGSGEAGFWSLEGAHASCLATSPQGTATGFGCTLLLIDDLIKNAQEACDDVVLERHWEWFSNTMISRIEEGGKIILIMTRWSLGDLAGRILTREQDADEVLHVCMKALDENGRMLCPDILSRRSYEKKRYVMGAEIAAANYQQEPLDVKGRLYNTFLCYDTLPRDGNGALMLTRVRGYVDVADTGEDFLCAICYGEREGMVYLLDVLYTDAPMEQTEPETARLLADCAKRLGYRLDVEIESNNGGRGFARAVERHLREIRHGELVRVSTFCQTKNKRARILSNATWVTGHIYFPTGWQSKWPELFKALATYRRTGRNAHDDAPDVLTGIAERAGREETFSFD